MWVGGTAAGDGGDGVVRLAGVRLAPAEEGQPLLAQVKAIEQASPSDMTKMLATAGNFSVTLRAGEVALIPSGFIIISYSESGAYVGRRCYTPYNGGSERPKVSAAVLQSIEAFSELKHTTWEAWAAALAPVAM